MNSYISFVEEMIMNPKYEEYRGGRLEVYNKTSSYAVEEIRFFTPKYKEYLEFRRKWDMKTVTPEELRKIRKTLEEEFNDR
jgi:hypothetical protein